MEGREKEKERHISVWLPLARSLLGTWPQPRHVPQAGNRTGDPLVHRLALNPVSHISQGCTIISYVILIYHHLMRETYLYSTN